MSKKANSTAIGLFVMAGMVLGVVGLLVFSSSRLFTRSHKCILYFDSSLNGLNEGAPVKYRGVTVGYVKHVMIHFNQASNDFSMPVMIEIQDNLMRKRLERGQTQEVMTDLAGDVRRGLRGTLEADSFVTGVLYVGLDTLPDAAPPLLHQLTPVYFEIPTQTTHIEQLMKNLASLDIKGLEGDLKRLISKVDATLEGMKVEELRGDVTNLLDALNRLVRSTELTNTLATARNTIEKYGQLADRIGDQLDPLVTGATNTMAQADATLTELRAGAESLRGILGPDSALNHDLSIALNQLANAAESISTLAEFLRAHPNALLTGRENLDKKP